MRAQKFVVENRSFAGTAILNPASPISSGIAND